MVGLLAAALAVLFAVAAILMLGAACLTALHGGPWRMPAISRWAPHALMVLAHPRRPGHALGQPWATQVSAHPAQYWIITLLILVLAAAIITAVALPTWRRFGPSTTGHATREEIHAELSPSAARSTAEWTRPSLTAAQRARVPVDEVGAPLHRGPHGEV
ncbi:MAG TPA: type IV secretory system conjugative DNA transfer family protein, partial [Pseudonocardiaceae bacterium]|nr:type IV secretory system conjugative DNA transfer family protein [Pseudonocardiaceae bacterium]